MNHDFQEPLQGKVSGNQSDSTPELAHSQAELKAVYDASPVMLCVVDRQRNVLFANPAFTDFTGVPEGELIGGCACGVFGCINALEDTRGCGYGSSCPDCSLIDAIQDTLTTGKGHQNIEYTTTIVRGSGSREVYMLGSTARIESFREPRLLLCLNDVTDRKKAELKVEALLREKTLLLKESHHRIKNNMGMVESMLKVQAREEMEGASRRALETATGRVHSMMVLYDKLYQSEHQHELNIRTFLEPLVQEIVAMGDRKPAISTDIAIQDFAIQAPRLSPLAIIVNELLTNSIKYAFKDVPDPRVSLSVSRTGTTVSLKYRDNGPGLPVSAGSGQHPGFGLQLIEILVKQINGSMEIKRNGEASCTIRFEE